MNVRFELRPSPRPRDVDSATGQPKLVEYLEASTGRDGKDVLHRQATPEDIERFRQEWAAFKKLHPSRNSRPAPKK